MSGGEHRSLRLRSLVLQQVCFSEVQIWALFWCSSWKEHMVPYVFQLVFCWPWCILVLSFQLLWRQGDWMKTFQCQSPFVCSYVLFFHVLGRSANGLIRIRLWGGTCDPYAKELFSQLFHSLLTEISNLALSDILTLKFIFINWQKCGFYLDIFTDLSRYLCLRIPYWVVPHCINNCLLYWARSTTLWSILKYTNSEYSGKNMLVN